MSRKEFYVGIMAVIAIAFSRMIPHPPNFTPVISMAAFGGLYFDRSWKSLLLPLTAMMLSDIFIGVHTLLPFLYLVFALISLAPRILKIRPSLSNYLQLSFLSTVFFFVLSNFFVWAYSPMYEKTFQGLSYCFALAIPFFGWSLLGTLFYSVLLSFLILSREKSFGAQEASAGA